MLNEFPHAIAMQHVNQPDQTIYQADAQCILEPRSVLRPNSCSVIQNFLQSGAVLPSFSLAASVPHCILHAHFMVRHLFKPKARISTADSRRFELPWLFRSPHSNKLKCPDDPLSFYPGFSSLGLHPRRRASLIYGDGGKKKVQKAYFGINYPSSRRLPLHPAS